ncbi:MAG: response regulator [Thermoanaerobaculia bacterium]|jgi:CheY-like chemotaxis protein
MDSHSPGYKGKILVIDDSETALSIARRTLEAAGYSVLTSNSALRLPAIVHAEKPDLILLDVEMPALRGDQVLELTKLFDFLQKCPIVLHSSKPEEELQELVGRSGASGYIKKTSNSINFISQVEEWLKTTRG